MSAKYGTPAPIQPSNGVKIISTEVRLTQTCPDGWAAVTKKEPALVRQLDIVSHVCNFHKFQLTVRF